MTTESPDGALAVIPSVIMDDVGVVWSLSSVGNVLRNGIRKYIWSGNTLLWAGHQLYIASFTDRGYALNRNTGGAVLLAPDDPLMEILVPKPRIDSFVATPTTIKLGGSAQLAWSTSNGKKAFLDGAPVALISSMIVKPTANHTYRLVVQGKGADAVATVSVVVQQATLAQTIDSFTVTPASIVAGQSDVLAWQTSNATQVLLDDVAVATVGSKSETPGASVTHTLVAKGSAADVTRTASVTVTAAIPAPTISNFAASPSTLPAGGGSVTLNATVANATSVTLDGVAVTLPKVVNVVTTTTFSLAAHGQTAPDATATVGVTVQTAVNRPPVWQSVPNINFIQGVAGSVSVAQYASDPDGNPLAFTLESGTLPPGISFSPSEASFSYDGRAMGAASGSPIMIGGIAVGADDGRP